MAAGTNRTLLVIVVFAAGAAIGYVVGKSAAQAPTPTTHRVLVGPTANQLSKDPVYASIGAGDFVTWKSTNGKKLDITFEAKNFPAESSATSAKEPPFVGNPGVDLHISCPSDTCFSFDINPKLLPLFQANPNLKLTYKYNQTLAGTMVDGRIIIQW
jgi:plastocyanin